MSLFKYITLCFFISTTYGFEIEPGRIFTSPAASSIYLEYTGEENKNFNGQIATRKNFKIYQSPVESSATSIGFITLGFSPDEHIVMLDRLEINKDFRRKGAATAAIVIAFKVCDKYVNYPLNAFRVAVAKHNEAACNLYTKLGFKPLSDDQFEKVFGALTALYKPTVTMMDLPLSEFRARYPKPAKTAIAVPVASPGDGQSGLNINPNQRRKGYEEAAPDSHLNQQDKTQEAILEALRGCKVKLYQILVSASKVMARYQKPANQPQLMIDLINF